MSVRDLRFVTLTDIQKLHFSYPTQSKHAGKILHALAGGADYRSRQFLFRFPLPDTRIGNTTKIYTLVALGAAYIRRVLGREINWPVRSDKLRRLHYYPLQHALTLTRFLVEAMVSCRARRDINLTQVITQYDLPRLLQEKAGGGKQPNGKTEWLASAVPDAWLSFEFLKPDGTHARWTPVLLEIDRATEYQQSFKTRLLARLMFIKPNGQYKAVFGTNLVRIAYATTNEGTPAFKLFLTTS